MAGKLVRPGDNGIGQGLPPEPPLITRWRQVGEASSAMVSRRSDQLDLRALARRNESPGDGAIGVDALEVGVPGPSDGLADAALSVAGRATSDLSHPQPSGANRDSCYDRVVVRHVGLGINTAPLKLRGRCVADPRPVVPAARASMARARGWCQPSTGRIVDGTITFWRDYCDKQTRTDQMTGS
jgi:hypothetical protein